MAFKPPAEVPLGVKLLHAHIPVTGPNLDGILTNSKSPFFQCHPSEAQKMGPFMYSNLITTEQKADLAPAEVGQNWWHPPQGQGLEVRVIKTQWFPANFQLKK